MEIINNITASIVLYKTNDSELRKVVESIFNTTRNIILYLVDNSPTDELKMLVKNDNRIKYIFNKTNIGFGAAHNIAIDLAMKSGSKCHFIVNPDIYFENDIITPMISYMQNDKRIGMMMPQVLNEDGTIQNLPKLLPSPYSVLLRKLKRPKYIYNKFINNYELQFVQEDKIYNAPVLSGCFTLLNLEAIKEIGMYDDKYFMYFEDWDLSRRIHQKYKTVYFPKVSVYHGYESGANKNIKLFIIFIKSAFIYFTKWGWIFDKERIRINQQALSQFR